MRRLLNWFGRGTRRLTFWVSKATTAVVAILAALTGLTTMDGLFQVPRLVVAFFIFIFGLPIGLAIFGGSFNIFLWLATVVVVLFAMNLHNTWEVITTLRAGGLDFMMASQAVSAVNSMVPTPEGMRDLQIKINRVNKNYANLLAACEGDYEGRILDDFEVPKLKKG
jgi:hypothetical protein